MNKSKVENGEVIEAFREKFEVRNYEADAHAWDIHIIDLPDEIEAFITNALNHQRELKEEFRQKLNSYEISSGAIDDDNEMLINLIKECREFLTKLEGKE